MKSRRPLISLLTDLGSAISNLGKVSLIPRTEARLFRDLFPEPSLALADAVRNLDAREYEQVAARAGFA